MKWSKNPSHITVILYTGNHRLNMELDLQSLFGLHVTSSAFWTRITRALLVSQDRRHLFVTPCYGNPYRESVSWVQDGGGGGVREAVSTPREKAREWGRWDSTRGNRAGLENVGYRTSTIKKEIFLISLQWGAMTLAFFWVNAKVNLNGIFVFCCFVIFFASKFDKSVNMT